MKPREILLLLFLLELVRMTMLDAAAIGSMTLSLISIHRQAQNLEGISTSYSSFQFHLIYRSARQISAPSARSLSSICSYPRSIKPGS